VTVTSGTMLASVGASGRCQVTARLLLPEFCFSTPRCSSAAGDERDRPDFCDAYLPHSRELVNPDTDAISTLLAGSSLVDNHNWP